MNRITSSSARRFAAQLRRPNAVSQTRWSSTEPTASDQKPVSPHIGFYKTFARPIAKVLLMATFTYQLAYFAWVKLEKEEIKSERRAEIESLEKQLEELTKGKGKEKAATP
ncbi:hypothetical protein M430DRAFT_33007 [Amorphotheca resinae ATCC 22711]|uniref:Uncharacterized protein n=1 Tax=Amorphotheca resinae ATCC 22711 TaxID=857342 RepID=A0A2T3BA68_AMORE|nr:hypothetical protein M430DRAFT_33007 [Amorphotheca resinae ATCC 22711]PSS25222.1 hypothetical protein M430DRAFT_33007 [Amorphotheca resinae ATCC 22711]